MALVISVFEI